jgi:ankyrin repeat protein
LHHAAEAGFHKVVKILLDNGADVNTKDHDGNTALHTAARKEHFEIVKILLDRSANVNEKNVGVGETALHMAAKTGNFQIVELLFANGAEVNLNNWGNTLLHAAAETDMVEILRDQFGMRDLVNARNNDGSTPLHTRRRVQLLRHGRSAA